MCFYSNLNDLAKGFIAGLYRNNYFKLRMSYSALCHTVMKFAHMPNDFFESKLLRRSLDLKHAGYKVPNLVFYYLNNMLCVANFPKDENTNLRAIYILQQQLAEQLSVIRILHLNLVLYNMLCTHYLATVTDNIDFTFFTKPFFQDNYITKNLQEKNIPEYVWERFWQNNIKLIISNDLLSRLNLPLNFFSRDTFEFALESKWRIHLQDPLQYALSRNLAIAYVNPIVWFLKHNARLDLADNLSSVIKEGMLNFLKNTSVKDLPVVKDLKHKELNDMIKFLDEQITKLNDLKQSTKLTKTSQNELGCLIKNKECLYDLYKAKLQNNYLQVGCISKQALQPFYKTWAY